MSKKASGSKNNTANRGAKAVLRTFNGKTVFPVLYRGSMVGHGNFMAAKFEDGSLVVGATGAPVPYGTCDLKSN